MVGSLGEIVFDVSESQILTFDGLSFQHSAKYTEHAIHGRKGLLEFTGFSATTMSMTISLNSSLGINPKDEFERLKEIFYNHEAVLFILNGEPQGDNLWVIENMTEKREDISRIGIANFIEVSLSLKEYLEAEPESEKTDISEEEFNNDYYGTGNW